MAGYRLSYNVPSLPTSGSSIQKALQVPLQVPSRCRTRSFRGSLPVRFLRGRPCSGDLLLPPVALVARYKTSLSEPPKNRQRQPQTRTGRSVLLTLVYPFLVHARRRGLDALTVDGVKLHAHTHICRENLATGRRHITAESHAPRRTCRSLPARRTSSPCTTGLSSARALAHGPQTCGMMGNTHDLLEVLAEVRVVDLDRLRLLGLGHRD